MEKRVGRRVLVWASFLVLILSLVIWGTTRNPVPRTIRIAAGPQGGMYFKFASLYASRLKQATGRRVIVLTTQGDVENRHLLDTGQAELGLLQVNSEPLGNTVALCPLYDEVVHVIARRGRGIAALSDLTGKRVVVGAAGSGTRADAERILIQHQIVLHPLLWTPNSYLDLETHAELDAAFITTGLMNPDLQHLLQSGRYVLISVPDVDALTVHYPFYKEKDIPRGLYLSVPPVPDAPVPTLTVKAFLATQTRQSDVLVNQSLDALYTTDMFNAMPGLTPIDQARLWTDEPIHSAARAYLKPYAGLDVVTNFIEALSGAKDLLVALIAAIVLIVQRVRSLREKKLERLGHAQKERLDEFVRQTMEIENQQMAAADIQALQTYLDEVARIKLAALDELTHEAVRGNQMFFIFLLQCSNLMTQIQNKIIIQTLSASVLTISDTALGAHSGRK